MASNLNQRGQLPATGSSKGSAASDGDFNLSISGTFAGTVDLERSFDGGTTWSIVESYIAPTEQVGTTSGDTVWYRLTFTRTSGTVDYALTQFYGV